MILRKKILKSLYFTIIFVLFSSNNSVFAQNKIKYGAWYLPSNNTTINGISLGLFNYSEIKNTITNGIRFELIGVGIILPLIPEGPSSLTEKKFNKAILDISNNESVYGFDLSVSGTVITGEVIGISIGGIAGLKNKFTGIIINGFHNFVNEMNGFELALGTNDNYCTKGMQISILKNQTFSLIGVQVSLISNISRKTKGIQLGLWNVNEKRKLPIFNWNF